MVDSEVRIMSKWLLAVGIVLLGGALVAPDAEARRIGGGRSVGTQRNVTAPPAQTPAKPAQQAAPTQQGAQQAAPASAGSRWGGILGGLALGGLLGYFLGGSGFGGALMGFLLLAGIVFLAVMAFRAFASRRQEHHVQYAGMRETVAVTPQPGSAVTPAVASRIPAGFDAAGFLRGAKLNFLKLQAANDAGQLDEIREFTTTEVYEELKKDLNGAQQTEVSGLEAELLELTTEGNEHWASVRFSGAVREASGAAPEPFAEIWNLVKPADGSSGWLLAGIQQMH
jgi:predicted lipid-binding transport protein (Tim44 family)